MDSVLEFIKDIVNEYKSQYLSLEQDMQRVKEHILETENRIASIRNSIDESYVVMSSSQTANEVENTELQSLTGLLTEYKDKYNKLCNDMEICSRKVDRAENIAKEYNSNVERGITKSDKKVTDKLELILKLMKPDPARAEQEIKTLIMNLNK